MALSTETAAWLADLKAQGNLDDTAYNALKASLESNAAADNFVKGSQLRQADYSRAMADTQKAVKDLKDKEVALSAYQVELGTWKQGADQTFQQAVQQREAAERKLNNTLARLKSTAASAGISEDEVLKDLDVTPVITPTTTIKEPMDTSKFVTREQIVQTVAESALVDAAIYDIAEEYRELTGKPLRDAAKLVSEALAAKVPLTQYVAQKFDFAKLRNEKSEAAIATRISEAVAAERTKILSDAALSGGQGGRIGRDDIKGSPILGHQFKAPEGAPQPGGGISAAVAAFNQGTYKVGGR